MCGTGGDPVKLQCWKSTRIITWSSPKDEGCTSEGQSLWCIVQLQKQGSMRRQLSHMGELVHSALGDAHTSTQA